MTRTGRPPTGRVRVAVYLGRDLIDALDARLPETDAANRSVLIDGMLREALAADCAPPSSATRPHLVCASCGASADVEPGHSSPPGWWLRYGGWTPTPYCADCAPGETGEEAS